MTNGLPLMSDGALKGASCNLQSGSVQNKAEFESFLSVLRNWHLAGKAGLALVSDPELRRVSGVW